MGKNKGDEVELVMTWAMMKYTTSMTMVETSVYGKRTVIGLMCAFTWCASKYTPKKISSLLGTCRRETHEIPAETSCLAWPLWVLYNVVLSALRKGYRHDLMVPSPNCIHKV